MISGIGLVWHPTAMTRNNNTTEIRILILLMGMNTIVLLENDSIYGVI
jgi:hypothetical protein